VHFVYEARLGQHARAERAGTGHIREKREREHEVHAAAVQRDHDPAACANNLPQVAAAAAHRRDRLGRLWRLSDRVMLRVRVCWQTRTSCPQRPCVVKARSCAGLRCRRRIRAIFRVRVASERRLRVMRRPRAAAAVHTLWRAKRRFQQHQPVCQRAVQRGSAGGIPTAWERRQMRSRARRPPSACTRHSDAFNRVRFP